MNAFLNALTGRKAIRDYQHASRTFRDGNFRLAPKQKFLFYVVFNLSPTAAAIVKDETKREISMLVKSVELPTYTFDTTQMNQYNRVRNIQSKLNFNPINIRIHDDMADISRNMWYAYMDYYYTDQAYENFATYRYKDTYGPRVARMFGYERANHEPFFDDIRIYSIYGKKFTEYTLINPLLTNYNHDSHDHSQSDVLENIMQVEYELVKYATGFIGGVGSPTGFGDLHYDKKASPLSPEGGGTTSLFGVGGLFDATGQMSQDLASGKFGSAAIQGLRTFQNFQNVDLKSFVNSEISQGVRKALKGENPFAFPGSAGQSVARKFNPLPKTNFITGTGTVTGEDGNAVQGTQPFAAGPMAYLQADASGGAGSVASAGGMEFGGMGVPEGGNSRVQSGFNMSTMTKSLIVGAAAGAIMDGDIKGMVKGVIAGAAAGTIINTLGGATTSKGEVNTQLSSSSASSRSTTYGTASNPHQDATAYTGQSIAKGSELAEIDGEPYIVKKNNSSTWTPEAGE
jgi:hypothetical protein